MYQQIVTRLNKPYRAETSATHRWMMGLLFGGFVFLFLLVFQPFGLNTVQGDLMLITLGYGLTTFTIMSILNVGLVPLFPQFFNEEKWNVKRELTWNLVNIILIGFGNVMYSAWIGMVPLTLRVILVFEFYTFAVGFFPVTVTVLFKEARLNKLFSAQSQAINVRIEETAKTQLSDNQSIRISSENINDDLHLPLNDLYFIRSADNYVEVYFQKDRSINKKLLRNSLKNISSDLAGHTQLFRCHKSYLVNLKKIKQVFGNAQGYKLHLSDSEILIPVSRQFNAEIRDRLSA